MLDRAGRALQAAFRKWNQRNWKWTTKDYTFTVNANQAQYDVPYDFKDVYTLRLEGAFHRPLVQRPRRDYDRRTWRQVPSYPTSYNTLWIMPQGKLELMPTPVNADVGHLRYYARMPVPCAVSVTATTWAVGAQLEDGSATWVITVGSTEGIEIGSTITLTSVHDLGQQVGGNHSFTGTVISLDNDQVRVAYYAFEVADNALPNDFTPSAGSGTIGGAAVPLWIPDVYLDGILDLARYRFLVSVGGNEQRKMECLQLAKEGLAEAWAAENEPEDADFSFEPPFAQPAIYLNPNLIID